MKPRSIQTILTRSAGDSEEHERLTTVGERMDEKCSHVWMDPTLPAPKVWDTRKAVGARDGRLAPDEATIADRASTIAWLMEVTGCEYRMLVSRSLGLVTKWAGDMHVTDRNNEAYKFIRP